MAPLGHIILIPSQQIVDISPLCRMLSGEASNTHFIVLGLLRLVLELAIYRTQGEHSNHYTTDAVHIIRQHIKLKRRAPTTVGRELMYT